MKRPVLQPLRWCALFSFLFCFTLFGQTKKASPLKNNQQAQVKPAIYVVGNHPVYGQFVGPAYTKNGQKTALTQEEYGLGNAIHVSGNDVYVAGDIKEKPAYWKNGQLVKLSSTALPPATGLAIAVYGNDVYVAGNGYKDEGYARNVLQPRYWKNGQEFLLPQPPGPNGSEGEGSVVSMSVIDGDVYIIGRYAYEPVYWKNGKLVNAISNDLQRVESMCKINGDAYVVGAKDKHAAYWKNGQTKVLTTEESLATAIAIEGNDVYVAGVIGGYYHKNLYPGYGNPGDGVYWKNGEMFPLEGNGAYPQSIAVSAGDVYIVGFNQGWARYDLWKNGKIIESPVDSRFVVSSEKGNGTEVLDKKGNLEKRGSAQSTGLAISKGNRNVNKDASSNAENDNSNVPQILEPKNYTVFSHFPRKTKIAWIPVAHATEYDVIIEYASTPGNGHQSFDEAVNFHPYINGKTKVNAVTFEGVGSQVHRYKIQARNKDKVISATEWFFIDYLQ